MDIQILKPPYNHSNPKEAYSGKDAVYKILGQYNCECGSLDFTVYFGEYSTIIKCIECAFEYCVHVG